MAYDYTDGYVDVLKDVHKGHDVEIVAYENDGYMYEWDVAVVYRVIGEDIYYLGSGSGCSCDGYDWYAAYGDLSQFSSRRSLLSYLRNSDEDKIKALHSEVLKNR